MLKFIIFFFIKDKGIINLNDKFVLLEYYKKLVNILIMLSR